MKKVDVVIVGNIAYDVNTFPNRNNGKAKIVVNNGGAGYYSLIPASIYAKVGIVARIGVDFDINILKHDNIDLKGLKIVDSKTCKFHHTYESEDGQQRTFKPEIYDDTLITENDIPSEYYGAKYIHIATNFPKRQLEIIEEIRKNSDALISIDTHEAYMENESKLIRKIFDMVDIAFIDREFINLLDCKAKIRIIKMGKLGCKLICGKEEYISHVKEENVIDKTGAGDVVAGVFLALLSKNMDMKMALDIATREATESIKNYGVEHLKEVKNNNIKIKKGFIL